MTIPDHFSEEQPSEQDLRQRVQALEAALQTAQRQDRALWNGAPAPLFVLNSQGRIEEVNVVACGLLEQTRSALLGQPLTRFLAPESGEPFRALLGQVAEDGLNRRGEAQLARAGGTRCDVLLDLNAQRADGGAVQWRLVMTDLTGYRRVEARTPEHPGAPDHEHQLREQARRIRELNQELDQVFTVLIQQLQLPLARAMNFLGMTRRVLGEPSGTAGRPLLNTERAVQQAIALLASVNRYMQVRHMRVRLRSVDLGRVLAEVIKNAQPVLADRDVQLTHDPLPTVRGDSQALYVILDEYVANALKFTKGREQARIHVLVQDAGSEYRIGVEDNGVGFDPAKRNRLFQLFGRLHPSRVYEGSGVGLVTVERVCRRFGGRVWAEGEVDRGATFWFSWPKEPVVEAEG